MPNRALCIGINDYPGTNSDLSGCVNDAKDWAAVLGSRGFEISALLLDAGATKFHIMRALGELVKATEYREALVITYSGHGTWVPDGDGDEPDRRDEALCPHDIMDGQLILDDELYEAFTFKRHGSKIILISDSCHSGTVMRLMGELQPVERPRRIRFLPPGTFMRGRLAKAAERSREYPVRHAHREVSVLFAGCQDNEYSYDAWFRDTGGNWRANGAFTRVALDVLDNAPDRITLAEWYETVRTLLPSQDYPQQPCLFGPARMKSWRVF